MPKKYDFKETARSVVELERDIKELGERFEESTSVSNYIFEINLIQKIQKQFDGFRQDELKIIFTDIVESMDSKDYECSTYQEAILWHRELVRRCARTNIKDHVLDMIKDVIRELEAQAPSNFTKGLKRFLAQAGDEIYIEVILPLMSQVAYLIGYLTGLVILVAFIAGFIWLLLQ